MHGEAAHNIGIYSSYYSNKMYNDKLFMGLGTISGGRCNVTSASDNLSLLIDALIKFDTEHKMKDERSYLERLTGPTWSWVNKYIDCSKFFSKIKDILKK